VQRSLLKCGISNAMDGSEDDALYSDIVQGGSEDSQIQADVDNVDNVDNVDDDDSDDSDDYTTATQPMTEEDFHKLFGHSDDEDDVDFDVF
jgi:hypothetical protein